MLTDEGVVAVNVGSPASSRLVASVAKSTIEWMTQELIGQLLDRYLPALKLRSELGGEQ
ncbi:MAG: hypothetical protein K6T75_01070 [Acetobacteraceae bacterium]|nr:hypothetical protein [Acetobacteraceae bacterium]